MNPVNHRCAILGRPIAHSLSPVLHNAAYRYLGLTDWVYGREEVGEDELPGFLSTLDGSWRGLSLTMPLKRTVQPFGVPSDAWSKELHVSNTAVIVREGDDDDSQPVIRLYNTDIQGIVQAFRHAWDIDASDGIPDSDIAEASIGKPSARSWARQQGKPGSTPHKPGANAVILGNGNTALSALAALSEMTIPKKGKVTNITICARTIYTSDALRNLADRHRQEFAYRAVPLAKAPKYLNDADVVVNTIPSHGADTTAHDFVDSRPAVCGTLLDVVYDPRPTELMLAWRKAGGKALGGERMLLYQAVAQVLLMTGMHMPPRSVMMEPTRKLNRTSVPKTGGLDLVGLETAMEDALREAL